MLGGQPRSEFLTDPKLRTWTTILKLEVVREGVGAVSASLGTLR